MKDSNKLKIWDLEEGILYGFKFCDEPPENGEYKSEKDEIEKLFEDYSYKDISNIDFKYICNYCSLKDLLRLPYVDSVKVLLSKKMFWAIQSYQHYIHESNVDRDKTNEEIYKLARLTEDNSIDGESLEDEPLDIITMISTLKDLTGPELFKNLMTDKVWRIIDN